MKRSGFGQRARANGIGVPKRDVPPFESFCTSGPVRRAVSPASSLQRAKAKEGCRIHGQACGGHDPMHVIDRSLGGCDDPLCVIPACRAVHTAYDEGGFDVLPYLSLDEQAHAVGHLGIARAYRRITNERKVA